MNKKISDYKVTFALLSYNQEDFIVEAIKAALEQDYHPLEIVISDDCSTDNTYLFIQEITSNYQGLANIILNKNEANIGLIPHILKINSLSSGDIIVVAAGDDISCIDRVSRIMQVFRTKKDCCYVHSAAMKIDCESNILGLYESPGLSKFGSYWKIASSRSLAVGATCAWNRHLIESFPPIDSKVWAEDLILGFRAYLHGCIYYIEEPLVKYRYGNGISFEKTTWHKNFTRTHIIRKQRLVDSKHYGTQMHTAIMLLFTVDSGLRLLLSTSLNYLFMKIKRTMQNIG